MHIFQNEKHFDKNYFAYFSAPLSHTKQYPAQNQRKYSSSQP